VSAAVNERLKGFARALLERSGALVDWEEPEGIAVLPAGLARKLDVADAVRLTAEPATGAAAGKRVLSVNLATDFMERVEGLVAACPTAASLRLEGLYLKKSAMGEPVGRMFGFPNARVRVAGSREVRAVYHFWYFGAQVDSEDRWEDLIMVQMNALTGAQVDLPDPLTMTDALPGAKAQEGAAPDLPRARKLASLAAGARASDFVGRLERRLERDRQRIREYYGALLEETTPGRTRGDEGKIAEKRRAVTVEMRRRLAELDERYALRLRLDPVAVVLLEMPALEVELEVSRRSVKGSSRVYWNPLRKELEPLACAACGVNTTVVRFDDGLRPLCAACGHDPK
jgi:hypothetical protein